MIAANTASHAVVEIAWLMPDTCSAPLALITSSGSVAGDIRLAAEPARMYENAWPDGPCVTK